MFLYIYHKYEMLFKMCIFGALRSRMNVCLFVWVFFMLIFFTLPFALIMSHRVIEREPVPALTTWVKT